MRRAFAHIGLHCDVELGAPTVMTVRTYWLLGLLFGSGCEGVFVGSTPAVIVNTPAGVDAAVAVPEPECARTPFAPAPIRRMTRWEYENTVADLLGEPGHPAVDFGSEEEALGFENNAEALSTGTDLSEKYLQASEGLADRAVSRTSELSWLECPNGTSASACPERFVRAFGLRAFRRPLEESEVSRFVEVFAEGQRIEGAGDGGSSAFQAGAKLVIAAALNTPDFLYRVEAAPSTATAIQGYELASRLSYLLWNSMPDDALFKAAADGRLMSATDIEREATRMLADPKAKRMAVQFHASWLDFDRVASVRKAETLYPEYSSALGSQMQEEMRAFLKTVIFDESGTYDLLLGAPFSVVNDTLARHYSLSPVPPTGAWQKVSAPNRAGILTQGSLMTFFAHSDQTSPVHRGKLIRENFLCQILPPPPADVVINVPVIAPGSTARERFEQHSRDVACSGCHSLMDPIGFGFENFDTIGRYRTTEGGKPIDASGEVTSAEVDGPYVGVRELAGKLAQSEVARQCYVTQWFRFAYGRAEQAGDTCNMKQLRREFDANGGRISDLLLGLTKSDAFTYRSGVAQ